MSSFFSMNMIYAILCFISGHVLGWYATNLQFVSEFWKGKVILPTLIFGLPCLLFFWWGTLVNSGHPVCCSRVFLPNVPVNDLVVPW